MIHKTINKDALLTPPSGGRGGYIKPRIEIIPLDNEISLALVSTPPDGPGEIVNSLTQQNLNNPFKELVV